MKPEKMTVLEIFQRERRLCVPLFQRAYVWGSESQWQPLWEDVARQAEAHLAADGRPVPTHFLGAVVIALAAVQGRSVARADVIDGQQRLTTLQLLIAAVRDVARAVDADPADIDTLIRHTTNPVRDPESPEVFKVWPTNTDRRVFSSTMRAGSAIAVRAAHGEASTPLIAEAYLFFHGAVEQFVLDEESGGSASDRVYALMQALQTSLQLVVIELEAGDDSQMIFETLNARGQPLLPSDLIRNFVFMRAASRSEEESARLYHAHWEHFDDTLHQDGSREPRFWHQLERQGRLFRPRIDLFIFHYLTMKTERDIRIGHLFEEFRSWWAGQDDDVPEFLADLKSYAAHYRSIALHEGRDRMSILAKRLSALDTSTVHPLLLYLAGLGRDVLDDARREVVAGDIESFLVRRHVVKATNKNYNRFFLGLLSKVKTAVQSGGDVQEAVREELLRSGEQSAIWPDDETFLKGWLHNPVYVASRSDRSAMLLTALNSAMATGRNERLVAEGLTVEHLLPQRGTLEDYPYAAFPDDGIDPSPSARRQRLLHTVGNLTLLTQGLNSSVSNGAFAGKKQAIVADSDARINAWLRTDELSAWNENDILERGRKLFEIAITIWAKPSRSM